MSVYIGVALGAYFQSFSDRYGRLPFFNFSIILQNIFGLLSIVSWSFESFSVFRIIYGFGMGVFVPLASSYITEVAPTQMRGIMLTNTRYWWSFGCIGTTILAWYFLTDSSWRLLLFCICMPGIYSLYLHRKFGKESLRFLWNHKKKEETFQLIQFMCQMNKR